MSAWNDFVKKIYHEGHNKNPNYSFKQALKDASKRKGEMMSGSEKAMPMKKTGVKKTMRKGKKNRKTRRNVKK
jgi:hypothetical protein